MRRVEKKREENEEVQSGSRRKISKRKGKPEGKDEVK